MPNSRSGLSRKLNLTLASVLLAMSVVFLLLLYGSYRLRLESERAQASESVNLLLQASLENAMLKRDLNGLQVIVDRLGAQPSVKNVAILSTHGEIRFSPNGRRHGTPFVEDLDQLCKGCGSDLKQAVGDTRFVTNVEGDEVLRSVNPVHNKQPCTVCHGPIDDNPVNGILVVDYDAVPIIQHARYGLIGVIFAGLVVVSLMIYIASRFMRREVIKPLYHLAGVSEHLAQGDLSARAALNSGDEFGEVASSFNLMADRLERSLQQLLEKEIYLQALIDGFPDGIRVIDEDFQLVNVNEAYCNQLQISKEQALGKTCYASSHGRDTPCPPTMIKCPVHEIRHGQNTVKTMQNFIAAGDRHLRVQVFAAPLNTEIDGKVRHYVVESIRDLKKDASFSQEQRLSALGQLAAGVGHEIRNPLGSIRVALESMLKKMHSGNVDQKQITQYLDLVDGEIDKAIDITERLLKLSTLSGTHPQLVDLHRAITDTASLLAHDTEAQHVEVTFTLNPESPRVHAVESDIRMLVLNLIQNAMHAMPAGGKLAISTRLEKHHVVIEFRDSGVGISMEDMPHIFEPFFSHRADGQQGVGLGLTICESIVQRYDGEITAGNVEPQGAVLTVKLPRVMESPQNEG